MHVKDSDCTVNPEDMLCIHCGVDHSETCPDCGGRGFHSADCPQMVEAVSRLNLTFSDFLAWHVGAVDRCREGEWLAAPSQKFYEHWKHTQLSLGVAQGVVSL